MSIRINATVQEARTAANHSQEQWDRFYFITKDEARQLAEAHPDWKRWILIPANEKEQMLERINTRLRAEGIPPVEMIILKWRVSQLLRDIQRKYEAGSMLQGMPDSPIASGQQRSVIEPTANGVFTKRDSSIRPNTGCVVPKPSEEICLLQCAFNFEKGTPDQHSVFEPDTPTAQRGMDNEDRAS
ncbi:hypothetical protein AA0113_g9152 [Alternaria arborescens]|uniref:Uncharacterized protein n=1 Tax=Alternaria arborescens TaxID=156630 RepID=A0A4Q4RCG2_9PLEO|nr:hypothetical protein AA0111_g3468 [Alternaria arborescens]RYO34983.1 hypothetical protein AA0111_g3468 [Alternaria arborescens]RYO54279.1 hypothetical protein AA0113_g9152 [Alternaria arborescens]